MNHQTRYNGPARWLHWLMAVLILGLAGLGFYMMTLTYYDPWYQSAPNLHRSVGVVVLLLAGVRWSWRQIKPPPTLSDSLKPLEKIAAHVVHRLLYGLMFLLPVSGYFISTAKGEPVDVFGLIEIPALLTFFFDQPVAHLEDWAGNIHWGLAMVLLFLVVVHGAGALKHHFIDQGDSLSRML
ncbi:MAG: cytochrome b [Magnetococcales bacterium]|nr:cytochrome b [Magnetococcales bacterium]